jgi:hypothetical protein
MQKKMMWGVLTLLTVFLSRGQLTAASMVVFDFDQIQTQSKKGVTGSDIEVYMESLFGSDMAVNPNATAVKNAGPNVWNIPNNPSATLQGNDAYLKVGRGRGPSAITFDFGANPINSFNVDWRVFKGGKSFTILADGVVIDQHILTKAEKKSGLSGHQDTYYFDTPVQKLEFIGLKKKSFAIDNLVINIPLPNDEGAENLNGSNESPEGGSNESGSQWNGNGNYPPNDDPGPLNQLITSDNIITNQVAADVPEPASLLLLAIGLCSAWASRRVGVQ